MSLVKTFFKRIANLGATDERVTDDEGIKKSKAKEDALFKTETKKETTTVYYAEDEEIKDDKDDKGIKEESSEDMKVGVGATISETLDINPEEIKEKLSERENETKKTVYSKMSVNKKTEVATKEKNDDSFERVGLYPKYKSLKRGDKVVKEPEKLTVEGLGLEVENLGYNSFGVKEKGKEYNKVVEGEEYFDNTVKTGKEFTLRNHLVLNGEEFVYYECDCGGLGKLDRESEEKKISCTRCENEELLEDLVVCK